MLRFAIQRPIAISMIFLAMVLIGLLSYKRLAVDLLPSITYPRLTVVTTYDDIPAEDLERMVTQPMEEVVTALAGVRRVVSRTRESVSTITVEYEWGVQMDFANLHLREAIDRVAFRDDFPEEASRPVILRWDPTSRPISVLVLEDDDPVAVLTDFAREVVKPALEQVDGISQAQVVGGAEREILVRPDPERLAIYNIDVEDIRQALVLSNITFPGGKIRHGPLQLSLRISGEFESLEQIAAANIPRPGLTPVRIDDVAEVIDTVKEAEGMTLLGSEQVVSILIYKEPEANTIQVSQEVDKSLAALSDDYAGFAYTFIYQDAEYVQASFTGLAQSLMVGAGLAFFILFFFLRDLRSPIVVGLSIPISIVITFALLYFSNVKLNLMSLGGLSLAVGMLVDNAIVVLENITRHRDLLKKDSATVMEEIRIAAKAAELGTREMARPVIAATLTTVAVFFPVIYVPGIAGAFFRDQALTVTFSLLISVATALLLQPMIASRSHLLYRFLAILVSLLAVATGLAFALGPFWDWAKSLAPTLLIVLGGCLGTALIFYLVQFLFPVFSILFDRLHTTYHHALERALRHPTPMLALLTVGMLIAGFAGTRLDRSFMPERSSGDLRLELEFPAGTPLEETEVTAGRLADWLSEREGVTWVFAQVGRTEKTLAALQDYAASNTARLRIIFDLDRNAHRNSLRLQEEATKKLETEISGVLFSFREEGIGLSEILGSGGAPFALGVVAEDPLIALNTAELLAEALHDVPGLVDLQVDRVLGTPNLVVRLDREEILRSGLDPERVGRELRNRVAGVEATTFNEVEQRIDIAVRMPEDQRKNLANILASPIEVRGGRTVPLRTFLDIQEERPVRELVRRNQRRMVTLTGGIRGRSLDDVWKDAMVSARELSLPPDVMLVPAGEQSEMQKSFRDLGWAMVLAILLVYMILAAQFESFLDPLLIAAVIPIGLAGAIIAIGVTGNTINILSMIGAVALLGIAVNDAIVKLDTVRRLREDGVPGYQAILDASSLRFRPILMTSATTMLAMIPMAIGLGSGEQLQRPLALTIIGGLALTTVLTLFYTPIMYKVAHRIRGEGDQT